MNSNSLAFDTSYLGPYYKRFKLIDIQSLSLQSDDSMAITEDIEVKGSKPEKKLETEKISESVETIPDPLESFNRFNYEFNDKLYFHLLKPVAKKYRVVVPERARLSIQNFFLNLYSPVRLVNCGLQGNKKGALIEFSRFTVNTTFGVGGFFDPAKSIFKLEIQEEDFGQTLGCFVGPKFYLNLPFLGPSSFRDFLGSIVDLFIVPSYYVLSNYSYIYLGIKAFEVINHTSLTLGEYEELKSAAIDPYISIRDAYYQHRESLIRE